MKKLFYTFFTIFFVVQFSTAQNCAPATAYDYLNINNVNARINNGGDMWWDLIGEADYEVPKSGNVSAMFAGALWIAGVDAQGELRVAAQTYRQTGNDFFPGPLDANGQVTDQTCQDFDRIWKINKSAIDSFNAGSFSSVPDAILNWPGKENPNLAFLPDQNLAPFVDTNGDGIYNPANGDYPDIPGDQALWFVINDNGNVHSETGGAPLQVEVQCLMYAFAGSDSCLMNTTFYHFSIFNKGANALNSCFTGLWNDPDLGCPYDDFIGCDTSNNLGIVYNAADIDGGSSCIPNYGSMPPVLAIDFLKGPTDENGVIHYLDHFMLYQNDFSGSGNPMLAEDYYSYLQSVQADGLHLVDPQGVQTNFAYTGDPSDSLGWSMCAENAPPADYRMVLSAGPFQFNPGEMKTLDFSVVWDNTSVYPCPSFTTIADVTNCVETYFKDSVVFTGSSMPLNTAIHLAEVFPNPSEQNGLISFHVNNAERIQIIDITGREVANLSAKDQSIVSIQSDLSKGVYLFKVIFSDLSFKTGKLVIQ